MLKSLLKKTLYAFNKSKKKKAICGLYKTNYTLANYKTRNFAIVLDMT